MARTKKDTAPTTIGEQLDGLPQTSEVLQFKQRIAGLPYADQVEAIKPSMPLQFTGIEKPVQFDEDPAAPTTEPGTETTPEGDEPFDAAKDTKFGQPFDKPGEAEITKAWLMSMFIPAVTATFGIEVGKIWTLFLTRKPGDSMEPRMYAEGDEIGDAFVRNMFTHYATQEILDGFQQALLLPEYAHMIGMLKRDEWVNFEITPEYLHPINYGAPYDIPGHLAGGESGSDAGQDSRGATGSVAIYSKWNDQGEITEIEVKPAFVFHIRDCVDFMPGGGGTGIEAIFTVPLSRLEVSGLAHDVPFEVHFAAPDTRIGAPLPEPEGTREKALMNLLEVAETAKKKGFEAAGELIAEKAQGLKDDALDKAGEKAGELLDAGSDALAAKIAEKAGPVVDKAADKIGDWLFGSLFK